MAVNIPQYASCLIVDSLENPQSMLLIKKNRPDWQAGKLNIIGGHIEDGESPQAAAIREVLEETGLFLDDARAFCILNTQTPARAVVYFFVAEHDGLSNFSQKTDEEIVEVHIDHAVDAPDVIPNLKYLIPLALDKDSPLAIVNESKK